MAIQPSGGSSRPLPFSHVRRQKKPETRRRAPRTEEPARPTSTATNGYDALILIQASAHFEKSIQSFLPLPQSATGVFQKYSE